MLDLDPNRPSVPARAAATLILLRDVDHSPFEVFLVRRHANSAFMGSAYVFPGGKLDPTDADRTVLARVRGRSTDDAARALGEPEDIALSVALYVAAIRETFEEAGVLLADVAAGSNLAAARARLAGGSTFAEVLRELDAYLRLDRLVPQARWVTPVAERRRFDTRFFVALAPPGQLASSDERETTAGLWLSPQAALTAAVTGAMQLPPPTLRTLENLAGHASSGSVLREAERRRPPYVDPRLVQEGDRLALVLPGDPAHATRTQAIAGPTRIVLENGRWVSRDP